MNQSEQVNELFRALSKAQSELRGAKKDSENPFFKSKYADLESVWDAAKNPLADNGLCVAQTMDVLNGEPVVVTTLGHASGQWLRGALPLTMVKKDPQSQGSAITYARRYALAAIVGVVQTDDDGESAMDRGPQGKGMIEAGNGVQPEGPRIPGLQKDATDYLKAKGLGNPSGRLVDSLDVKMIHALVGYLDSKYSEKEMPAKTAELHKLLIGRAMQLEGL